MLLAPPSPDSREAPGLLLPLPRQSERFPRSRAPSIDKCSTRAALAASRFEGARHWGRSFAAAPQLPTHFHFPALSRKGARPPVGSAGSSPAVRRGRAPLVDFCNQYDPRAQPPTVRTSLTTYAVARVRSSSSLCSLSGAARQWRVARPFQGVANRDVTGQGLRSELSLGASAPPAAIARFGSFAPTRSTRTPPVARSCGVDRSSLRLGMACTNSPGTTSLTRHPPSRAAFRIPPRRGTRSAAPEVFSTAGSPRRARLMAPRTVPSPWTLD